MIQYTNIFHIHRDTCAAQCTPCIELICSLGRWFDFLSVFEPLDRDIRVSHLHSELDLLAFVH